MQRSCFSLALSVTELLECAWMLHSTPPIQQNIVGTRQAHWTATRKFVLFCFVLFFLPQSLLLAKGTKCYFWGHNIQYNFANQIFPEFTSRWPWVSHPHSICQGKCCWVLWVIWYDSSCAVTIEMLDMIQWLIITQAITKKTVADSCKSIWKQVSKLPKTHNEIIIKFIWVFSTCLVYLSSLLAMNCFFL